MKIFIDAGHNYNGYDTGATGNGLREQDITYAIALELSKLLQNAGLEIKMSRNNLNDNVGLDLNSSINTRCTMANNWNADLFVSIHCNASQYETANGTETLIYKLGNSAFQLAQNVNNALVNELKLTNRGVKQRQDLGVLKNTNMPAILVETAFITNANDASKLKNNAKQFAQAIYNGICKTYNISNNTNKYEFYVNNQKTQMDSVCINDTNYIKLRDIVTALNGKIAKVEGNKVYIEK